MPPDGDFCGSLLGGLSPQPLPHSNTRIPPFSIPSNYSTQYLEMILFTDSLTLELAAAQLCSTQHGLSPKSFFIYLFVPLYWLPCPYLAVAAAIPLASHPHPHEFLEADHWKILASGFCRCRPKDLQTARKPALENFNAADGCSWLCLWPCPWPCLWPCILAYRLDPRIWYRASHCMINADAN